MRRRDLLAGLVAGVAAVAAPKAAPSVKTFGFLDVDGHCGHRATTGEFLHVYVNGADVTSRCAAADDVEGYVEVFCRDAEAHRWDVEHGALHIAACGGVACRHRIQGDVIIVPGAPL